MSRDLTERDLKNRCETQNYQVLSLRMLNFRNSEPDFFFNLFKLQLAILSAAVTVQPFSNLDPDVSNWATRK